ncbi:MAG: glycosyltransferase [Candidatus Helarchaeota archaeon]|nr:glycosyltransferase [Candidatus Helarchaeota archaeon]
MDFCVIMTVWNFNNKISFVIERAYDLFDHIIVLDTGSTDGSVETLQKLEKKGLIEFYHYNKDRGAGRDSNFLLEKVNAYKPEWIVKLDHDEYYEDSLYDEIKKIRDLSDKYGWITSYRVTLWKNTNKYRIDRRYRWFHENTMFRWKEGLTYPEDAIHHMERIPESLMKLKKYKTKARLIHLSQIDKKRIKLQIERLKEFERDWTDNYYPEKLKLKVFKEKLRKGKRN